MKCKRGIVYLLQHEDHVGTNIYKIGYSTQDMLRRLNGYPGGSILICSISHPNPTKCEQMLISYYNEAYELVKGREYFKVNINESELREEFHSMVDNDIDQHTKELSNNNADENINNDDPEQDNYDSEQDNDDNDDTDDNNESDEENDIVHKNQKKFSITIANMSDKNFDTYYCACCKFMTKNLTHVTRHANTNKHKTAALTYNKKNDRDVISKKRTYECRYCDKIFIETKARWRHEKKCKEEDENDNCDNCKKYESEQLNSNNLTQCNQIDQPDQYNGQVINIINNTDTDKYAFYERMLSDKNKQIEKYEHIIKQFL